MIIDVIDEFQKIEQPVIDNSIKIVYNGDKNIKPIILTNAIDYSPTASQSAEIYRTAIEGSGLSIEGITDDLLDEINLNDSRIKKITPNDLLSDIARELAYYQAVFILVRYNANYEKVGYKVLPYLNCRVGKPDDKGYSGKVVYHDGMWQGRVNEKDIKTYYAYNPDKTVINAQVKDAGGWDNYTGQVLFFKFDERYIYGRSLIEKVLNYAITEYEMGNYYKGLVLRRFEDVDVIRYRPFDKPEDERQFIQDIREISGLRSTASKLLLKDDWIDKDDAGNYKFEKLTSQSTPDKFKHLEETVQNKIRKAFKNIPPVLVDMVAGKLGMSGGKDIEVSWQIYNANVGKDRLRVERLLSELFNDFYNEKIEVLKNAKIKINQYKFKNDVTVE